MVNPYTDPNRIAQQAAQRAMQNAQDAANRSRNYGNQAADRARANMQKMQQDAFDRSRKTSHLGQSAGRKRGGVLALLIVLGLVALGAKLLGFF